MLVKFVTATFLALAPIFYSVEKSYEVCPKSNETGVIKTLSKNIEIYQSQIPSK